MTKKPLAEIGIVGAGPAGARAAELLASQGTRVVLLDPKAPWEKPCGGGLTPSAFHEIPELEEIKSLARRVTSVRVEAGPEDGFTVDLNHPLWILSRRTLGGWQLERALKAGAEHLPARVTAIHRSQGGWRLETGKGDVTVRVLVAADGAASLVRRVVAPELKVELAPTRVAYLPEAGQMPDTAIMRFYGGIAGYLWDFPRPDHRSVGIGVPNGTWQRPRMDGEIDAYRASSELSVCSEPTRVGAVVATAQLGHGDYSRISGEDFALLGDAAGFADPLTGEGIQNAMRSADLVVQSWLGGGLRQYPVLARRAFEWEFRVSRMLRRTVFESTLAIRLVERATRSNAWYAVVAALVNSVNERDGRVGGLLGRSWLAHRATRRKAGAPHEVRRAVPIQHGCPGPSTTDVQPGKGVEDDGTGSQAL